METGYFDHVPVLLERVSSTKIKDMAPQYVHAKWQNSFQKCTIWAKIGL